MVYDASRLSTAVSQHPRTDYNPEGHLDQDRPVQYEFPIRVEADIKILTPIVSDSWDKAQQAAITAENSLHRQGKSPTRRTYTDEAERREYEMLRFEEFQEEVETSLESLCLVMDEKFGIAPSHENLDIRLEPYGNLNSGISGLP